MGSVIRAYHPVNAISLACRGCGLRDELRRTLLSCYALGQLRSRT